MTAPAGSRGACLEREEDFAPFPKQPVNWKTGELGSKGASFSFAVASVVCGVPIFWQSESISRCFPPLFSTSSLSLSLRSPIRVRQDYATSAAATTAAAVVYSVWNGSDNPCTLGCRGIRVKKNKGKKRSQIGRETVTQRQQRRGRREDR